MRIFDFLFYYLALYFDRNPKTISWSTPAQRAGYALGLIVTSWTLAVQFFCFIYIIKNSNYSVSFWQVLIAIGLVYLFQYIYINKSRYMYIKSSSFESFKVADNTGIILAWVTLIASFALPFIILIASM